MNLDLILSELSRDDLPEAYDIFLDYLSDLNIESLKKEEFYRGDGLDIFRFLLKYLEGQTLKISRVKSMRTLITRYLRTRRINEPDVPINRLAAEAGLDERTVRDYLKLED